MLNRATFIVTTTIVAATTLIFVTYPCKNEAIKRPVRFKNNRNYLKTAANPGEIKSGLFNLMEENNFQDDVTAKCTAGLIFHVKVLVKACRFILKHPSQSTPSQTSYLKIIRVLLNL